MRAFSPVSALPVLRKELLEEATRKRMYVLRVVAIVALATVFFSQYADVSRLSKAATVTGSILGAGGQILDALVVTLFAGIHLLLPPLLAGSIAQERERGSLSLLLITGLSPWEIVTQKLLSKLYPMLTLLFLSLPLMGVAYSLGGISATDVWISVYFLALACLQVGTITLVFSSVCGSQVSALVSTYVLGVPLALVTLVAAHVCLIPLWIAIDTSTIGFDSSAFPGVAWSRIFQSGASLPAGLVSGLPFLVSSGIALLAARLLVERAPSARPRNHLLAFFRVLDRIAVRLNDSLCRGVLLWKSRDPLPEDEPVRWREVYKRGLGKPHYLLRILVALEIPLMIVLLPLVINVVEWRFSPQTFFGLEVAIWNIAAVTLVAAGVNLVASERSKGTLEVLLTTPLDAVDVLRQKHQGLRRLRCVFAVPLCTVFASEGLANVRTWPLGIVAMFLYLSLLSWYGLLLGTAISSRARALTVGVLTAIAWVSIPMFANDVWRQDWFAALWGAAFPSALYRGHRWSITSTTWPPQTIAAIVGIVVQCLAVALLWKRSRSWAARRLGRS